MLLLQDEVESEKLLAELRKSVNGVISDGRKKRSFAEVSYIVCIAHVYTICSYSVCMLQWL